jgi:high affinity Mn2+ porin
MDQQQTSRARTFLSDCERIHREWHIRAKALDTEGLIALYAADALLESPLVTAILDGRASGILRGHDELRLFFAEGARRRPNELVRWYRTSTWLTDGEQQLVWEYPRAAPDGDQVDILEVMDVMSFPSTLAGGQQIETASLGLVNYEEWVLMSGTVRGRIGYAFDNWLPYVTGGFAWSVNQALILPPDTLASAVEDVFPIESRFLLRFGWTIGAGIEVPFAPNWTAKAEYLFTDYSSRSVALQTTDINIKSNLSLSELRFGLNYRLPANVAAVSNLTAAAIQPDLPDVAVHAQTTFIGQYAAPFRSPYQGTNSLSPNLGRESLDVTLYAGLRPWQGAEIWFNPEINEGFALNDVHGVAAFPNADVGPGFSYPVANVQRLFLRQTIDLGPATEKVPSDLNQFAMTQSNDRLVITAGKFAVGDIFDWNRYATDVRTDFMNLAIVGTATFDNAQDTYGYTYGVATEWYQGDWTLRGGYFDLSLLPGKVGLDPSWGQVQYLGEIERRYILWGQPGKMLFTGFLTHAKMARYNDVYRLRN